MRYIYTVFNGEGRRLDISSRFSSAMRDLRKELSNKWLLEITDATNMKHICISDISSLRGWSMHVKKYPFYVLSSPCMEDTTFEDLGALEEAVANLKDTEWLVHVVFDYKELSYFIKSLDALEEHRVSRERVAAWKPFADTDIQIKESKMKESIEPVSTVHAAVSPNHYKNYIQDLQWLEAMQYLPRFRNPDSFKAAVEMQVRKYLDRCGGKDSEEQELMKAGWYLRFLTAYVRNGNKPIRVVNIDELLK